MSNLPCLVREKNQFNGGDRVSGTHMILGEQHLRKILADYARRAGQRVSQSSTASGNPLVTDYGMEQVSLALKA